MKQGYVTALDPLRFFAALAVVLYHYGFHDAPSARMAVAVTQYGYLGVPLFFMISGFVISMSIQAASSPAHFLLHRAIRLYPAFVLCAFVTVLFVALFTPEHAYSAREVFLNMTMFGKQLGARLINGAYWSLAVEWTFYLLVTISCAVLGKSRFHLFMWGWWAMAAVNAVVHVRALAQPLILGTAPLFIAGVSLYMIMTGQRRAQMLLLFVLSLPISLFWVISDAARLGLPGPHAETVVVFVMLTFYALMTSVALGGMSRKGSHPLLRAAGATSYPLYLLHETIGSCVLTRYSAFSGSGLTVCLIVAMVLAAWAVTEFYERPLQRWLNKHITSWFPPSSPTGTLTSVANRAQPVAHHNITPGGSE